MKSNQEIGREFKRLCANDPDHLHYSGSVSMSDEAIGAAARKAVGDPPRMMIEGMSVEEIMNAFNEALTDPKRPCESVYVTCAKEAHRLANTEAAPEPDPDALAREVWKIMEEVRQKYSKPTPKPIPFDEAYVWEREICRAIAKWMEEKK